MAIELGRETVVSLRVAAAMCGRKSPETVRVWIRDGLLDAVLLPGGWVTSVEALRRMADKLAMSHATPDPDRCTSTASAAAADRQARRKLEREHGLRVGS